MQLSAEDLVQISCNTIAELVLPNLPQNSWEAGYLKSALALLTCAQFKIGKERRALSQDTSAILDLLARAVIPLTAASPDDGMVEALKDSLDSCRLDPLTDDFGALAAENERVGATLNRLILWTHDKITAEHNSEIKELRALFREYSLGLVEHQRSMFGPAAELPFF